MTYTRVRARPVPYNNKCTCGLIGKFKALAYLCLTDVCFYVNEGSNAYLGDFMSRNLGRGLLCAAPSDFCSWRFRWVALLCLVSYFITRCTCVQECVYTVGPHAKRVVDKQLRVLSKTVNVRLRLVRLRDRCSIKEFRTSRIHPTSRKYV